MAGWSEGYVIPRLASARDTQPLVRGVTHGVRGAQQGHGAYAEPHLYGDKDDDSRRHLKAVHKLIYSARCIYCKSFHHPDRYCFRLSTFPTVHGVTKLVCLGADLLLCQESHGCEVLTVTVLPWEWKVTN